MSFTPKTNVQANFLARVEEFREILRDVDWKNSPHTTSSIRKAFGYEPAISESTLSGALLEVGQLGRIELLPQLAHLLSSMELHSLGIKMEQHGQVDHMIKILPLLEPYMLTTLFQTWATRKNPQAFDVIESYANPTDCTPALLIRAAENDDPKFGKYILKHVNVLEALRPKKWKPEALARIDVWWLQAIQAGDVPPPHKDRSFKYWAKLLPAVSSLMIRSADLDEQLPQPTPRPPRPRF